VGSTVSSGVERGWAGLYLYRHSISSWRRGAGRGRGGSTYIGQGIDKRTHGRQRAHLFGRSSRQEEHNGAGLDRQVDVDARVQRPRQRQGQLHGLGHCDPAVWLATVSEAAQGWTWRRRRETATETTTTAAAVVVAMSRLPRFHTLTVVFLHCTAAVHSASCSLPPGQHSGHYKGIHRLRVKYTLPSNSSLVLTSLLLKRPYRTLAR